MDPLELTRTTERIEEALAGLRPFLNADGGDISLEEITSEWVVKVRLHGACNSCAMSSMTMKAGVEETIKRVAPNVRKVVAVNKEVVV